MLEECHELVEAIDSGDVERKIEEIGDLMLHCAFQIAIAEERGETSRKDVFRLLSEKLRRRHPHVFGAGEEKGCIPDWERIKEMERSKKGMKKVLDGLPVSLPPLLTAYRLQERVSRLNFDWHEPGGAFEKVGEELEEVREKHASGDREGLEAEIGDLLFAVVNLSRLLGFHPENSLRRAIDKFAHRFDRLLEIAEEEGIEVENSRLEELDAIWDRIKEEETNDRKRRTK